PCRRGRSPERGPKVRGSGSGRRAAVAVPLLLPLLLLRPARGLLGAGGLRLLGAGLLLPVLADRGGPGVGTGVGVGRGLGERSVRRGAGGVGGAAALLLGGPFGPPVLRGGAGGVAAGLGRRGGAPAGGVAPDDLDRVVQDAAQVAGGGLADVARLADHVADPVGEVVQRLVELGPLAVLRAPPRAAPAGAPPAEALPVLLPPAAEPARAAAAAALAGVLPLALALPAGGGALLPLLFLLLGAPGLRAAGAAAAGGGELELLAERADGVADVLLDRAGDVAHRLGELALQVVQVGAAVVQLLAAAVGEPVDLAAVHLLVGDQALLLQAGQARVDGPGRGRVHPHEAVPQQA